MKEKIFISYSRQDLSQVSEILKDIELATWEGACWIDLNGIESDKQFVDVIISAINKVEIVLFMYSPNSANSEWTKKELEFAKAKRKKIVFVNLNNHQLSDWFLFNYSGHDIIDVNNVNQKAKMLRNLSEWCGVKVDDMPIQSQSVPVAPIKEQPKEMSQEQKQDLFYAKQGDLKSQKKVAQMYLYGDGVCQDTQTAIEWYSKAFDQGDMISASIIASIFQEGKGIEKNMEKAVYWFSKVAESGDMNEQIKLGRMYEIGDCVHQSYSNAAYWYLKVGEKLLEEEEKASREMKIPNSYSNNSLPPINGDYPCHSDIFYDLLLTDSDHKVQATIETLGKMYCEGLGVKIDYQKSITYYTYALQCWHSAEAMYGLAQIYERGLGVDKDIVRAQALYSDSAARGNELAQQRLVSIIEEKQQKNDIVTIKGVRMWSEKKSSSCHYLQFENIVVSGYAGQELSISLNVKELPNLKYYGDKTMTLSPSGYTTCNALKYSYRSDENQMDFCSGKETDFHYTISFVCQGKKIGESSGSYRVRKIRHLFSNDEYEVV